MSTVRAGTEYGMHALRAVVGYSKEFWVLNHRASSRFILPTDRIPKSSRRSKHAGSYHGTGGHLKRARQHNIGKTLRTFSPVKAFPGDVVSQQMTAGIRSIPQSLD